MIHHIIILFCIFKLTGNSSSSSLDYVDSEDSYKPFNEDNYSIKSLEPPNHSIIGKYYNIKMVIGFSNF